MTVIKMRRTFKYRMYTHKRNQYLHDVINISGIIWNHCIALQRRYYKLTGKYISKYDMQKHIAKMRNRSKFSHYQLVGSQAVQNICERHDAAYQRFFNKQGGKPNFKKVKKYKSFTLKQAGWKLLGEGRVRIMGRDYRFVQSRPVEGKVKTVTIKRDTMGRVWICFSVEQVYEIPNRASTGKTGGFDFGLKTFLTNDEGQSIESPQFFKQGRDEIRKRNQALSRKRDGSNNRKKAKLDLARAHNDIANKRSDFHWKLAHALIDEYDTLYFEDLNIEGMKRLWGRKISDLGFSDFMLKLKHVARKKGVCVEEIDRWTPTSKTCSQCGCVKEQIGLHERTFACERCGLVLDRDHNAALNIKQVGASTCNLEAVSRDSETCRPAALFEVRIPRLQAWGVCQT